MVFDSILAPFVIKIFSRQPQGHPLKGSPSRSSRRVRLPSSQVKNPINIFKRKTARRHKAETGGSIYLLSPSSHPNAGITSLSQHRHIGKKYRPFIHRHPAPRQSNPARSNTASKAYPQMSQMSADKGFGAIRGSHLVLPQRPQNRLRLPLDHLEQNPRRPFGMPYPLLPVAHRLDAETEGRGKAVLRQPQPLAQLRHIDLVQLDPMYRCPRGVAVGVSQGVFQSGHDLVECFVCHNFMLRICAPAPWRPVLVAAIHSAKDWHARSWQRQ